MPLTFIPAKPPAVGGVSGTSGQRVLRAEFGDGYSQRARDGLNFVRRKVSLTWKAVRSADADAILAFLRARAGSDAFYFTVPGESVPILWTNGEPSDADLGAGIRSVSVELTQEFDLI